MLTLLIMGEGWVAPVQWEASMLGSSWGVSEEYGDARVERCRVFMLLCKLFFKGQSLGGRGIVALQAY